MGEPDIAVFGVWSVITIIVIVITGLVYRAYRRTKNGPSAEMVVIKPITVMRYTLFCKIAGTYICRTAENIQ